MGGIEVDVWVAIESTREMRGDAACVPVRGAVASRVLWPGAPYPLGATFDGAGTNFSIYAEEADAVELCLFSESGEESRVRLQEVTGFCWHGYLPQVGPGQRYGYRVYGPHDPERGLRFNPRKLLLDPYAKAVDGTLAWSDALYGHLPEAPRTSTSILDSAAAMPKAVVTNPYFDWGHDRPPGTPWHETIVYETHVKGFTARHPDVPENLRGTYAGLAHPSVITYLKDLGVTAVELMPVHHFVHDHFLVKQGLTNYWGYNSIAYLAPHAEYASPGAIGSPVHEFKQMVKSLHEAGIEVILDVVYNHTAEGNDLGPTLSFKGIDNQAYYRIDAARPSRYIDFTGCGNSLNMQSPFVLQLIMDSLRYWVLEMHVDGFRFDLAAALARELHEVDRLSAFFDLIHQDPVISQVKLIAEPWDIGEGGYQVGNFPIQWSEWNGKYRDTVRDYWRGQDQILGEFAHRITGSSDLYRSNGRQPHASINFVTAHDGFTMRDLVSYNEKHNQANGEDNRDGETHNRSWNCGVEGDTFDPAVLALRDRQVRNFLVTMFVSQGVPMLLAGDEVGRSQKGNNNTYCQDNELNYFPWTGGDEQLLAFTKKLIHFRKAHPVFQRRRWFEGSSLLGSNLEDIGWFRPDGTQMMVADWQASFAKSVTVFLNGEGIPSCDRFGQRIVDDSFLVLFNAHFDALDFVVPPPLLLKRWRLVINSATDLVDEVGSRVRDLTPLTVPGRSVLVLRLCDQPKDA